MATVTSKYSTNSGYEADNCVECKPLFAVGGQGVGAPSVETDCASNIMAVSALGSNLVVLHISEATQLRTANLVDF